MRTGITIAAGLAAVLAAGAAYAQPGYQGGYYQQEAGAAPYQQAPGKTAYSHPHHGVIALVKEEVRAGRMNHQEGMLLEHKIKQLHAEKRAERQARYGGEGAYGPHGAPPAQMQQPQ